MNEVYAALSHPTRRDVVRLLAKQSCCAGEIAEILEVSKPNLSVHLGKLHQAGLVGYERNGTRLIYYINTTLMQTFCCHMLDLFSISKDSADFLADGDRNDI